MMWTHYSMQEFFNLHDTCWRYHLKLFVGHLDCQSLDHQSLDHHHHHHHPLFLKRPFLPRSARVRRFSRYEATPHVPEHCPFRMQTKLICIICYTFSPSLPAPTRTSHPCHHHISTGRHPIISTFMFHMPKPNLHASPPQPRSEHPKDCTRLSTSLPILQIHTTHPSHHHTLCSPQALQILSSALPKLCRFWALPKLCRFSASKVWITRVLNTRVLIIKVLITRLIDCFFQPKVQTSGKPGLVNTVYISCQFSYQTSIINKSLGAHLDSQMSFDKQVS